MSRAFDTLEEYKDSMDYFTACYTVTEAGCLVLKFANETFLKLYNLKNCDLNKPVEEIFPQKYYKSAYSIYNTTKEIKDCCELFREIGGSLWKVYLRFQDPDMLVVGQRVNEIIQDNDKVDDYTWTNCRWFQRGFYGSVLLRQIENNRFHVESYTSFLSRFLKIDDDGCLIENENNNIIKSTKILCRCIELNKPFRILDKLGEKDFFVAISIVPLCHNNVNRIIVAIHRISERDFYELSLENHDISNNFIAQNRVGTMCI